MSSRSSIIKFGFKDHKQSKQNKYIYNKCSAFIIKQWVLILDS